MTDAGDRRLTTAAVAVVAVPYAVLLARVAAATGHVFVRGDLALADLAVRRALRWHELLGPYDRFGWRHPGPAWFYLVATVGRLLGGPGLRAQTATAVLVDGAAAVAVVLLTRRLLGARAAAVAGAVTAGAAVGLGPIVMWNPWTPYVVILPLVALLLSAAAAVRGSGAALAAIGLVGSACVQTDIGVLPLVAVTAAGAAGGWTAQRRGHIRAPDRRASLAIVATVVATAALWLPAAVEQLTATSGNLGALWRFFAAGHPHAGLVAGASAVGGAQAAVFGAGSGAHPAGLIAGLGLGLIAAALGAYGRRPMVALLGVVVLVAAVAAVLAGAAVVGEVYRYLVAWAAAPVVVGGVAVGAALGGYLRGRAAGVALLIAVGAGAALLYRVVTLPSLAAYSADDVAAAWSAVAGELPPSATVMLDIRDGRAWAVAAGLADELERHGSSVRVSSAWAFQYGADAVGTAGRRIVFDTPGTAPAGRILTFVDGVRVSVAGS